GGHAHRRGRPSGPTGPRRRRDRAGRAARRGDRRRRDGHAGGPGAGPRGAGAPHRDPWRRGGGPAAPGRARPAAAPARRRRAGAATATRAALVPGPAARVRITVTRGVEGASQPTLVVLAQPLLPRDAAAWARGIALHSVPSQPGPLAAVKSLSYLERVVTREA